jgi:hypothetical protein
VGATAWHSSKPIHFLVLGMDPRLTHVAQGVPIVVTAASMASASFLALVVAVWYYRRRRQQAPTNATVSTWNGPRVSSVGVIKSSVVQPSSNGLTQVHPASGPRRSTIVRLVQVQPQLDVG